MQVVDCILCFLGYLVFDSDHRPLSVLKEDVAAQEG